MSAGGDATAATTSSAPSTTRPLGRRRRPELDLRVAEGGRLGRQPGAAHPRQSGAAGRLSVPTYRDEGVVLRTQKLGEADRIVTLLTREHGRVRAVAKGVRRTSSRFGARLEPFRVVDIQLHVGRSLDVVTQVESRSLLRQGIVDDYRAYTAGTAMLETAERLTPRTARGSSTCCWSAACVRCRGEHDPSLARRLPAAGALGRRLGAVVRRLRRLRRAGSAPLVLGAAGRHGRRPAGRPGRRTPAETLPLLGALLTGDWATADASDAAVSGARATGRRGYLQWHLERGLRCLLVDTEQGRVTEIELRPVDWTGVRPPAVPAASCPGTWPSSWTATAAGPRSVACLARRATTPARRRCSTSSRVRWRPGVQNISAYAFSTENWRRSPDEVRFLMGFNRDVIRRRRDEMHAMGVRVRWAGRRPRLWKSVIDELEEAERLHRRQHRAHPDDVRQLRRHGRDR